MANKRAALGRMMLATVGKIAPEAQIARPLPLDQRPGFIMPPYFSKKTVFYATDRTTLYAIKILHDGKVCVASFTIRMGESPERFLLEHAKKMENDRKLCWFGQLTRRDFRPDPYSEIFSVSHQNSSETLKYRVKYVPEYDSRIVDILDLASPTISRARYRRFELR